MLLAFSLACASSGAEDVRFNTRAWQVEEGLPDNLVNKVIQDQRGFLWLATGAGLARFDSVKFQELRDPAVSLDYGHNIRDLAITPSGTLLTLPSSGGVLEWKDGKSSVHPVTSALSGLTPLDLYVEPSGVVWVGAEPATVIRWEKGEARRFGQADGINRRVNKISFATDGRGRTWVASGEYIGWYHQGKLVPLNQPMAQIGSAVLIAASRSGGLWISSADRLLRLDNDRAASVCELPVWPARRSGVQCMYEDAAGRLWVGTRRDGLFLYAGGELKKVSLATGLVSSVVEDSQGNIWVATGGDGLWRLRTLTFTVLDSESGLFADTSSSVASDGTGAIWCANRAGGLARFENGTVTHYGRTQAGWLFASRVASDAAGNIWMAADNGLYRLVRSAGQSPTLEPVQPMLRGIHVLHGSRDGRMWVVSNSAVGYFENDSFHRLPDPPDGALPRIDALAENDEGDIWFSTAETRDARHQIRLMEYSGGKLVERVSADAWTHGPIHTLFFDRKGALWIGSAAGLVLKDGDKLTRFSMAQGLADDLITQIQEDDLGYLWCAGRRALFRVKADDLRAVAEGSLTRVASTLFGVDDGLSDVSAPGYGQPRTCKTPDGKLWFTLHKGIVGVDPAAVMIPREAPPLILDEVRIDGQPVPVAKGLVEAPAGAERIAFRFAVLDFSRPEHVVLRCKLEGFDRDWLELGSDRLARYSRVSPGRYRLLVQASNLSGVWEEQQLAMDIHIPRQWWQSPWLIAGVVLVCAAGVAWVARIWTARKYKARMRRLEREHELERERARIARNLHDELGGSLTQIGLIAERLRRSGSPEEVEKALGALVWRTQGLANDLESIVWTVSPQNDSWDRLAAFIARHARMFFESTPIDCVVEGVESIPAHPLSPEVQHEVLAILKEVMNNVLKHSKATVVKIDLDAGNGVFEMQIRDNGTGFEPSLKEHSERNGLNNMRSRSADLGGRIAIESRPGAGTTITLTVALAPGGKLPPAKGQDNL